MNRETFDLRRKFNLNRMQRSLHIRFYHPEEYLKKKIKSNDIIHMRE